MLPPYYWFRMDNKHMTEPWLDEALMNAAYRSGLIVYFKILFKNYLKDFFRNKWTLPSTFYFWLNTFLNQPVNIVQFPVTNLKNTSGLWEINLPTRSKLFLVLTLTSRTTKLYWSLNWLIWSVKSPLKDNIKGVYKNERV